MNDVVENDLFAQADKLAVSIEKVWHESCFFLWTDKEKEFHQQRDLIFVVSQYEKYSSLLVIKINNM